MTAGRRWTAWPVAGPIAAWVALGGAWVLGTPSWLLPVLGLVLMVTVFAAVHHAERVAHRIGEPFGTLVLAVAVTVIEVALIVSVMLNGGEAKATLARDTVFAAVMICCNGIMGLCLLLGGIRHHEQDFHLQGSSAALAVLEALVFLSLILPNFAITAPGPYWSPAQLAFAGVASLVLYGAFVFVQTVRHRDYFLAPDPDPGVHAPPPTARAALASAGVLVVALVAVVALAKQLSPAIQSLVVGWGAPEAVVGVVIAVLVLLPEGLAATRAAYGDRIQTSLNLALGSALASIGLTIPTLSALFILLERPLVLGLAPRDMVLLVLTLLVTTITLGTGRTTVLQGVVHLVILAAFVFLSIVP